MTTSTTSCSDWNGSGRSSQRSGVCRPWLERRWRLGLERLRRLELHALQLVQRADVRQARHGQPIIQPPPFALRGRPFGRPFEELRGRADHLCRAGNDGRIVALSSLQRRRRWLLVTSIEKGATPGEICALKREPPQRVLPLSFGTRVPGPREDGKDVDGGALRIDSSESSD